MDYEGFLKSKIVTAPESGFQIEENELSKVLKPHQKAAVLWALRGGRRALFESFGLGKTVQQLEWCRQVVRHEGGRALIVLPLGVKQEFSRDSVELLGMEPPEYVRTMDEVKAACGDILMTNYERVRDGDIDPAQFTATSLDEASVLRSFGSKTYQTFLDKFRGVRYKLVNTATPSPNKYKELIHYAGYLEVMDTGQALTRFFQRDSTKANNLTLYPHKEEEFWLWVSSWALVLTKPSDLGFDDEGYALPPIEVRRHIVTDGYGKAIDRDGQFKLQNDVAVSLSDEAREKRESIDIRVQEIERILFGDVKDERRKERILQKVVCGEQRNGSCEAERAEQEKLCKEQGKIQREKQEMAGGKPGSIQGIDKEVFGESQRGSESAVCCMVQGKQGSCTSANEKTEIGKIRDNAGRIRSSCSETGMQMCDMRQGIGDTWSEKRGIHRSRSQNGEGSRDSVHEMQFYARDGKRQCGGIEESDRISEQVVIWCNLNKEQEAIEKMLALHSMSVTSLTGSQSIDVREDMIEEWKDCRTQVFLTKPEMYGQGVNLQQCSRMIFAGISYKFEEFIQAIHRIHRFGQENSVIIDIICTDAEDPVYRALMEKWEQHNHLQEKMREIVQKYGLNRQAAELVMARSIGVERVEVKGKNWTAVNNDCVEETAGMEENSVDLIVTSIPFSNHYEYTPSYNDFGHNENTGRFFEQMGYLTPNLLRILKPGRVFACHVKDRVLFGNATGMGMPTMEPFHALCIQHYMQAGFAYFGMITVVTDVVRENNQTYRLGWTEQCKDGSKMGVGCPEYILLFRKLPSCRSKAYADEPVKKSKDEYTRAQWQIDAHGFWRSSGDRLVSKEELEQVPTGKLQNVYRKYSRETVYSYEDHVALAKKLDEDGHLPATFMVVAPGSWTDQVWDDINRMRTLNTTQSQRRKTLHVCPLQLDIVDRLINRYSNPDDLVLDPFGGLGTVALEAVKAGRKGYTIELNNDYFRDAVGYLKERDETEENFSLFDVI